MSSTGFLNPNMLAFGAIYYSKLKWNTKGTLSIICLDHLRIVFWFLSVYPFSSSSEMCSWWLTPKYHASGACSWVTEAALPTGAEKEGSAWELSATRTAHKLGDQLWDVIFALIYPGERLILWLGLAPPLYTLINLGKNFLNKLTTQQKSILKRPFWLWYREQRVGWDYKKIRLGS